MARARLLRVLEILSLYLFWPSLALIVWGELTPHPPDLSGVLLWDKAQHFTAYFGLASMATMAVGLKPKLAWAFAGIILLGGVLEILQGFTGRDPDILDFTANSIGAFAGLAVAALVFRLLDPLVAAKGPD